MNNGELVKQVDQMKRQYEQALQQTQSLTRTLQNPTDFGGLENQFLQLHRLAKQAGALSYASQGVDAAYRARYPGYESELLRQMKATGKVPENYESQMATLHGDTSNAMYSALAAAGFQADQMETEAQVLAQLRARSNSATGQLAAVQAGNQINSYIAEELRRGRQLTMNMMQSQTAWNSYQMQKQITDEAKKEADAREMEAGTKNAIDAGLARARNLK
ncbi:hypothetical protein [Ramlibacter alkalitolerans]|uniref:Uncharacterized protein n=1 Tax=Ramlibacter alkalitolerans TaxID=2039631 RepID=A0ABS1JU92_9BURK|nr:hypothetical protein [Ramlibacter alkalitolerans]MBL0427782.1 hypothetical protein [Ramlibacter alkalitolerans]